MLQFKWNEMEFSIQHYGCGTFYEDMAGHSHSKNSYELHYIVGGEGTLTTDDCIYQLKRGCFFVTGPNFYHQQSTNSAKPLKEIYILLQASDKKTKDTLVATFLEYHFYFCKNRKLESIFQKILEEKEKTNWGYESVIGSWTQILLTEITRIYLPERNTSSDNAENMNDHRFLLIDNAFIYRPGEITLHQLSEEIGLCERQTQRLLKKYYGKTFKEKKEEALKHEKSC